MRRTLLLLLVACLAGGLFFAWQHGRDRRCNVLLVVIDTCRADRCGFNGFRLTDGSSPTPAMDRFAAQATGLRWGLSPVPLTLPAVTSILSGLYPDAHGVRENDSFRVPARGERGWPLLAESLRSGGWETAAFVSAQPLERRFGLAAGFSVYDEPARDRPQRRSRQFFRERPAKETTDAALAHLERRTGTGPWFLMVHYFDPHAPYEEAVPLPADPPRAGERAYVSEIARVDRALGRLLEGLPRDGRETLVLVVGDHGEGLGDHGEATHGQLLHESTLRVPFLMKLPASVSALPDAGVPPRLVDVTPTILAVTGCARLEGAPMDGRNLLEGEPEDWFHRAETLYGYYQFRFARQRSLRDGSRKLVEAGSLVHLHDWRTDSAEAVDLSETEPGSVTALRERLLTVLQGRRFARAQDLDVPPGAATPYIGVRSGAAPVEPGEEENARLLPVDRGWDLVQAVERAQGLIRRGEFPRAAIELERHAAVRDRHPALLFWNARAWQRCDELEELPVATRLEHLERARILFERHAELYQSTRARDSLLRIAMRRSRHRAAQARSAPTPAQRASREREARGELERVVERVKARRAAGTLTLIALASSGQALERLGRPRQALERFEEALERDPDHPVVRRDVARLRRLLGPAASSRPGRRP